VVDYLGEWHTHPEVLPSPSSLDISEWQLICRRKATPMVFMIVGMDGSLWAGVGLGDTVFKAVMCSSSDLT
jgi:integrative and conjugative element protein (TIGR02256 family)